MKINKPIIVFLLGLFFFSPLFSLAQEEAKIPIAALTEKVYRLDNVIEGTIVTHDFILKNTGNADLIIQRVKSG
jgi:hypothetical protein